jgi:hypothetical protein
MNPMLKVVLLTAAFSTAVACTTNVEDPVVNQTGRSGDTTCIRTCDDGKTTCVAKCTDDACKATCETTHASCTSACSGKDGG